MPLKMRLDTGQTLVVAEGEGEARSLGSYSIRLYQAAPAADDTTFFQYGMIRPRDGFLQGINLLRLPQYDTRLVVVVMQSAGTGSYLAADAYLPAPDHLTLVRCVRGIPPRADLGEALRQAPSADVSCVTP
ncbi:MAG: hypothetical protein JO171_04625 [Paludibacterium sp.]|uniref:PliI family lysozyme inhibitor of I-type lysozyme n=1 Tax=Paludibacterium sp. TaxID=1917523 RepID=UPI0025F9000B|nr:PliI family lysozyme inhibitor of I-type lysozyme [Paludibacterium sp.]MBV8046409.1 hypothetical protein [Paludibacterium sp.]MBV8647971.1 hypothetical protein [Paludibacterium sp.]